MKTVIGSTAVVALTLALAGTSAAFAAETVRGVHFGPGAFGDLDQDQNGYISAEEASGVWARLDTNDDGRVSAVEYDTYLQRKTGEQPTVSGTYEPQISQTGRAGKDLAIGERVVPPGVPRDPRTGATVDQGMQPGVFSGSISWQQADADSDGTVSRVELNRYIADLGEGAWNANREVHFGPGAFTDAVFGEGGVPNEQALKNAWPRLDANNDGVLDRAEFAAFEETVELR